MAITKDSGRQEVIAAKVTFTFGTGNDVPVQGTYEAIQVPEGAVVVGGYLYVSDATTATAVADIGDGGSANRYKNDVALDATGLTALVPTGYQYTAQDTIDVVVATADSAAAGSATLYVEYVVDGRTAFAQG